jgi:predicted nucleic acid-binding protein
MDPNLPPLRAVIYLRRMTHLDECTAHADHHGYDTVDTVHDPDGVLLQDLLNRALHGELDVIVTWDYASLPHNTVPRLEFVKPAR